MKTYLTNNYRKIIASAIFLIIILTGVLVANTDTRTSNLNNIAVNATKNFLESNNIETGKGEYNIYLPVLNAYNYLEGFDSECITYSYVKVANGEISPNIICGTPTSIQIKEFNAAVFADTITCDEEEEGECLSSWKYATQRYNYLDSNSRIISVGIEIIFPEEIKNWSCQTINGLDCNSWQEIQIGDNVGLLKNFTENGIDILTVIPAELVNENFDPTINIVVNEIEGPLAETGINVEMPQTPGLYALKSELIDGVATNHVSDVTIEITESNNAIISIDKIAVLNQPISDQGEIIIPESLLANLDNYDNLTIEFVSLEEIDNIITLTFKINGALTYAFVFEPIELIISNPVITPSPVPTNYDGIVTATITTNMLINPVDSEGNTWTLITPDCETLEPIACTYTKDFIQNYDGDITITSKEYITLTSTIDLTIKDINEKAPKISTPAVVPSGANEVTVVFTSDKLINSFIESGIPYPFTYVGDLENGYTYSRIFTLLDNERTYSIVLTDIHDKTVDLVFTTPAKEIPVVTENLKILDGYPSYSPITNTDGPVTITIRTNKPINLFDSIANVEYWSAVGDCSVDAEGKIEWCEYELTVRRNILNPQFQFVTSGSGSTLEFAIFDIQITNIDESMPLITYDTVIDQEKDEVVVTITSNKRVNIPGWTNENGDQLVFTKTYPIGPSEIKVPLSDLLSLLPTNYELAIQIPGIEEIDEDGLYADITYANTDDTIYPAMTKNPVMATITTNFEIVRPSTSWSVATKTTCEINVEGVLEEFEDCWVYTQTFTSNHGPQALVLKERDGEGRTREIELNIQNIDTTPPSGTVSWNIAPTNICITASLSITTDQLVKTPDGWTPNPIIADSEPQVSKYFTKEHCESGTYDVDLVDVLGNVGSITYTIDNIQRNELVPTLSYTPSRSEGPTKNSVTATLGNEGNRKFHANTLAMLIAKGWICSEDFECTQTFDDNIIETLELKDIYGNPSSIELRIDWIDNEELEVGISYNPSRTYSGNNPLLAEANVHNASTTVTITCNITSCTEFNNKQLVLSDEQKGLGWSYVGGEDGPKVQITKVFTSDENSPFTIKDTIGNESSVNINLRINNNTLTGETTYSTTDPINSAVVATISATDGRELAPLGTPWAISEDGLRLSAPYSSNITNETITFTDIYGNTGTATINITNIDTKSPLAEVAYSTKNPTNKPVVVTVRVTEQVTISPAVGWSTATSIGPCIIGSLSSDTCYEYTRTEEANVLPEQTYTMKDAAGNNGSFNVTISNIDTTELTANVIYSNTELTNQPVTATITTNKPVDNIPGWTPNDTFTVWTQTFNQNFNQAITVTDEAGNTATVTVAIGNIDTVPPVLTYSLSIPGPTNAPGLTVTITSTKVLAHAPEGWAFKDESHKTITKLFTKNETLSVIGTDLYGNTGTVSVVVDNIDRIPPTASASYSTTNPTNQAVIVTITSNEPLQEVANWTRSTDQLKLTRSFNSNITSSVTITDLAGNTAVVPFNIGNINTIAPVITMNGEKTVTITKGTPYNDAGATAWSSVYGNINVNTDNPVNINVAKTYTITYTATDIAGNSAVPVTRTVIVEEPSSAQIIRKNAGCQTTGSCPVQNGTNNYVWYSGHLWRAYWVDGDNVKLVTNDAISNFAYGASAKWSTSNAADWLDKTFYPTLNNRSNIIASANYCNRNMWVNVADIASKLPCPSADQVSANVALLTIAEYGQLGGANSYLNRGDFFFTMTPYSKNGQADRHIWTVCGSGSDKCTSGEPRYGTFSDTNTIGIRPVITLRSDAIFASGNGTQSSPYRIANDNSASSKSLLNTRVVGEYVNFGGHTWRIIRDNTDGTRLILDNFWNASPMEFGSNNFNTSDGIGKFLNETVYNSFGSNEKAAMQPLTQYINEYSLGNPRTTTLGTAGTSVSVNVGLPVMGDILSARNSTNIQQRSWTINTSSSNNIWVLTIGGANDWPKTQPANVRPVIELRSNVRIASGKGTPQIPYVLSY